MPKYFFDIYNSSITIDDDGEDLPNRHAALSHATQLFGEILKDIDGNIELERDIRVVMYDANRAPLFELKISAKDLT